MRRIEADAAQCRSTRDTPLIVRRSKTNNLQSDRMKSTSQKFIPSWLENTIWESSRACREASPPVDARMERLCYRRDRNTNRRSSRSDARDTWRKTRGRRSDSSDRRIARSRKRQSSRNGKKHQTLNVRRRVVFRFGCSLRSRAAANSPQKRNSSPFTLIAQALVRSVIAEGRTTVQLW